MAGPRLVKIGNGDTYVKPRLVKQVGGGGGSGSGSTDYNDQENKPRINGIELKGNKTLEALGIASKEELGRKADSSALTAIYNNEEQLKNDINAAGAELTQFKSDIAIDLGGLLEEINNKANKTEEIQIVGWTSITPNTYHEVDIRNAIASGKKRFTILIYMRKGENRQATKYELTITELEKLFTKVNANELVITRMIMGIDSTNRVAMLKQFVKQKYDEKNQLIRGVLQIKYQGYENNAVIGTFDNFEYTVYGE